MHFKTLKEITHSQVLQNSCLRIFCYSIKLKIGLTNVWTYSFPFWELILELLSVGRFQRTSISSLNYNTGNFSNSLFCISFTFCFLQTFITTIYLKMHSSQKSLSKAFNLYFKLFSYKHKSLHLNYTSNVFYCLFT